MWLTGVAGVLFGVICIVQQACSESKVIHRKAVPTPDSSTGLEEDIQIVINQIHSLSDHKSKSRSSLTDPLPIEGVDLNAYYRVIENLYVLLQPLLRKGFLEDLPKTLVCVFSGKEDCGLEAELIKALSMEMGPPLLAGLSSLTKSTCSLLGTDEEPHSFFRTYLRMGDSTMATLTGIQDIFVNILTYFPVSGNLVNTVSGLMDTIIKYTLEILFTVLEVPVEYIKIALQFGIRVPSLDEEGMCEHGDLKQLIMWGLRHNVSWSFGTALIDILLDIFLAPEQSHCTYPSPDCPGPGVPFQRSSLDIYHNILLKCDHKDLAELNDTVCPEILAHLRNPPSASVLTFCKALSSLDPELIKLVWRNACSLLQAVMSPLTSRSAGDCTSFGTFPSPVIHPPPTTKSISQQDVPMRIVREASNLNELICDYNSWIENIILDPMLVSLCGDNKREEFVKHVCNNIQLWKKLVSDSRNSWVYAYCANSTADLANMVNELCLYEQWVLEMKLIDPHLLEFCIILDEEHISLLICQDTRFFQIVFSNPANEHLMPNCSQVLPIPALPDTNFDSADPCHYSHWQDPSLIHFSVISMCSEFDKEDFDREVCANQTFLNQLLILITNEWLHERCAKAEFNTKRLCDYNTWASRDVDDSVVALCWQHDQSAFQKNVCCNLAVFQRLLQDPRNIWLRSICDETEERDMAQLIKQVCKYALWTSPIIVDMTDLATCAWADPDNFTSKVCRNDMVLNNLLANQDNTWLIQHCHNSTNPGENPNGGQGQGIVGFDPSEQCLYLSWSVSLPDPTLVTLCLEHDRANFVSTICPNPTLFSALSQEPSNAWLGSMCATYANYTGTGTGEQPSCLAKDLVIKFNWTCSHDLALACRPGAGQNVVMQAVVRCWLESMRSRMEDLLTPEVTAVLDQAVSLAVVSLLALEEIQNTTYHVTENIGYNIVAFVDDLFKTETNYVKKRVILQCFGRVLTSLMQTAREIKPSKFVFIKEYFRIPVHDLRVVLSGTHITTIRMILLYYSGYKDTLQLPLKFLPTLTSVLLQKHLTTDWSLFPELASLLALASPTDIHRLPLLQNNIHVREIINQNLALMTLEQQHAFGAWFGIVMDPINIIRGQQSLIRDTGNLIAYLPFNNFQHLSAAQLLDGLNVLQRNTLSPIQQEFIAQRVIGTYKNLTSQDFIRLGYITCLADPDDLIVYKGTEAFPVIQDIIRKCTRDGLKLPSYLLSSLLLNSTQTNKPSDLTVDQIKEMAYLLPMLGVNFIQNLTPSQLFNVLDVIKSVNFSPAQASIIVEKLSSVMELNFPGRLQELGSLVVGVESELLLTLTSEKLLSSLPSMAQQTTSFSPTQCHAIATKLWGYLDVFSWLDNVKPLLYCTPLASVLPRTSELVINSSKTVKMPWNTQQAQAIFKKVLDLKPSLIKEDFQ
uniref:Stereocilin LRR domain-containing protein n=1 Tax=Neogobius melanostomus TaxID=47308 RepID=A0A8C6WFG2_9GOBI